jgi:hypothetical protein
MGNNDIVYIAAAEPDIQGFAISFYISPAMT